MRWVCQKRWVCRVCRTGMAAATSTCRRTRPTLLDVKPTGNAVEGKSGTAKSLAYCPSKGMLYVVHSFGPDHIRLMSVSSDGKLTPPMERYTGEYAGENTPCSNYGCALTR